MTMMGHPEIQIVTVSCRGQWGVSKSHLSSTVAPAQGSHRAWVWLGLLGGLAEGHQNVVSLLLDKGAEIDRASNDGVSGPLWRRLQNHLPNPSNQQRTDLSTAR